MSVTNWSWKLFFRRVVYGAYTIGVTATVIFVYQALMSRGLVKVFPDLGMKLSKVAGLSFLADFTATYRLSLAQIAAVIPLVLAYFSYELLLRLYLRPKHFEAIFSRWESIERLKRVIVALGTTIIIGDSCLFAAALMLTGWSEWKNPVASILATLIYQSILGFSTLVGMILSDHCTAAIEERDAQRPAPASPRVVEQPQTPVQGDISHEAVS